MISRIAGPVETLNIGRSKAAKQNGIIQDNNPWDCIVAPGFSQITSSRFKLGPEMVLSARASYARLSYRLGQNSASPLQARTYLLSDVWDLDLNTVGIDFANKIGGRLPDSAYTGNRDYHIYALFDWTQPVETSFRGYAAALRPIAAYTAATLLVPGATTVLTLTGIAPNHGNLFALNSRVILRNSTVFGAAFNQGLVTAHTATSITVRLDNQSDYSVNIASAGTIIQLDNFQPLTIAIGANYLNYDYCYVGMISTTNTNAIQSWRKRGDWYWFQEPIQFRTNTTSAVTLTESMSMACFMPLACGEAAFHVRVFVSSGSPDGFVTLLARGNPFQFLRTSNLPNSTFISCDSPIVPLRSRDSGLTWVLTKSGAVGAVIGYTIFLYGYIETNF